MPKSLFYPPADRSAQWFGAEFPGTLMPMRHPKLVLHTTETSGGWPGYGGGGSGPTFTYEPFVGKWRQHFRVNQSARALRDPEGTLVRENRADCVQVEVACYCDPARFPSHRGVIHLGERAYTDLGRFAAWLHVEWGLPLRSTVMWLPYPKSYGNNGVRLSSAEYADYSGILGHMHVSGNTHGDPGQLDVDRILRCARAELTRGDRMDRIVRLLRAELKDTQYRPAVSQALDAVELLIPERLR